MTTSTNLVSSNVDNPNWATEYMGIWADTLPDATLDRESGIYFYAPSTEQSNHWERRNPYTKNIALRELREQLREIAECTNLGVLGNKSIKDLQFCKDDSEDSEIEVSSEEFDKFMDGFNVNRGDT